MTTEVNGDVIKFRDPIVNEKIQEEQREQAPWAFNTESFIDTKKTKADIMLESKIDVENINSTNHDFEDEKGEKIERYKSKLFRQLEERANSKDDSGMDRIEKLCSRIPVATKDC